MGQSRLSRISQLTKVFSRFCSGHGRPVHRPHSNHSFLKLLQDRGVIHSIGHSYREQ